MAAERIEWVDATRGIGMVAVVLGHVVPLHGTIFDTIYWWHVPLFFAISGFVYRSGGTFASFARHRAGQILTPYLSWLVALTAPGIVESLIRGEGPSVYADAARILFGGDRLDHQLIPLWFLTALYFSLLAYKGLEITGKSAINFVVVFIFLASLARQRFFHGVDFPLSIDAALIAVPYIHLGRLAREHRWHERTAWMAALAALFAGAALYRGTHHPMPWVDIRVGLYGPALVGPLLALGGIAAVVLLAQRLGRASGPFVLVSKASICVLASHFVVVEAFDRTESLRVLKPVEFFIALGFSLALYAAIARFSVTRRLFLGDARPSHPVQTLRSAS